MTAIQNYVRGELVGLFEPFVAVLKDSECGKRCDSCFNLNSSLKKCSNCSKSYYCNSICQKKGWSTHVFECNLLKICKNHVDENLRYFFLILKKAQKDKNKTIVNVFGVNRTFNDLMDHKDKILDDMEKMKFFTSLINKLKIFLIGELNDLFSLDFLLSTYGKMIINSFGIFDYDTELVGTGLYLGVSILDHSCRVNSITTFEKTTIMLRANRDILSGEKITVNYIELYDTTLNRRKLLENKYYFTCQCSRCLDIELDSIISSFKCLQPHCNGNVSSYQNVCKLCGEIDENIDIREKRLSFKVNQIKTLKQSGMEEIYSETKKLLKELLEGDIQPSDTHLAMFELNFAIYAFASEFEEHQEAYDSGMKLIPFHRLLFDCNNLEYGTLLLKLSNHQNSLKNIAESVKLFSKAESAFAYAYGKDSPLYKTHFSDYANFKLQYKSFL